METSNKNLNFNLNHEVSIVIAIIIVGVLVFALIYKGSDSNVIDLVITSLVSFILGLAINPKKSDQ